MRSRYGRRAFRASPIRCVGERIKATGVPEFREVAWRACDSQNNNDSLGDGGFQECSGLEISMDVQEYLEGGRNDGVIQRIGRAKYSNIVLKRGMFFSFDTDAKEASKQIQLDLWQWLQNMVAGVRPATRYDGIIEVQTGTGEVVATWVFERGLPVKIVGPQLNGKTGDIAIEELHIAHEGLRLKAN